VLEDVIGDRQAQCDLRAHVAAATPSLTQFGGGRRVMVIVPPEAASAVSADQLSEAIGAPATIVAGDDNNLLVCVEASELPIQHVAVHLVQCRRDRVEFAQRVHSRTDVLWTPLVAASAEPVACAWDDTSRQTQISGAMNKTLVM
jgi:hypothetical protein